jgi:hypothetical protein
MVEFHARRPFHPQRLHDAIDLLLDGVIRSRGRLWLANRSDQAMWLESAGGGLRVSSAGKWVAAMSASEAAYIDPERRAFANLLWDDDFGDRHTSMTVLVRGTQPAEIPRAIRRALLTDDESAEPATRCTTTTVRRLARRPLQRRRARQLTQRQRRRVTRRHEAGIHPDYHPVVFKTRPPESCFSPARRSSSSRVVDWPTPDGVGLILWCRGFVGLTLLTGARRISTPQARSKSSTVATASGCRMAEGADGDALWRGFKETGLLGPIIVCIMTRCRRHLRLTAAVVVALTWGLVACGSNQSSQSRSTTSAGADQRPVR